MQPKWVIAIVLAMDALGGALGMKLIPEAYAPWGHLAVLVLGNALALFGYPLLRRAGQAVPPAALALVVGALALSGCALSPAGKAHVALRSAAEIGEGADKAITSYDTMIQDGAVLEAEAAGSTAGARAKLAEWRPKRMKARGIEQEYLAGVLGWQVALQIAENSLEKKPFDVGALLAGLAGLAQNLVQGLRKLGIEVPKIGVF
jgi:hypothetical protein